MDKKSVMSHMTHNRRKDTCSRGLIISAPKEWYFMSAQVDLDNSDPPVIRHPGDPAGQTLGILQSLKDMLDREGWSLHDVIRVQLDVTAEVAAGPLYEGKDTEWLEERQSQYWPALASIYQVLHDFFKDVDPKPVWGAVKIVSLQSGGVGRTQPAYGGDDPDPRIPPGALVELDFLAAR